MTRPVLFVDSVAQRRSGSAFLRTHQLWQLSNAALDDAGIQSAVTESLLHRDSVLVLNKNTMLAITPRTLAKLRRANNYVVADPLDGNIDSDLLDACDVILAASWTQFDAYRGAFPGARVAHVGHHVDLRLPAVHPPRDRFRLCYVGEIDNAAFAGHPDIAVACVPVDTSNAERMDWMGELARFNAHYALRASRSFDGFKPFTKGFVAAHCGCPVLIGGDDVEACRLLPDDYPFVADTATPESVRSAIDHMRGAFGGDEWRRAVAAMEELKQRCSTPVVASEFLAAISPLALGPKHRNRLSHARSVLVRIAGLHRR